MASRAPRIILEDLDKEMDSLSWQGPPSDLSHLGDPEHLSFFQKLSNYEEVISKWLVQKGMELVNANTQNGSCLEEFRICSIGCGDGALDRHILSNLVKLFPNVTFHYTGIDADEEICEVAESKLEDLAPNLQGKVQVEDYQELEEESFAAPLSFDLIIMINSVCAYYATSLEPLLKGISRLLKPTGELVIISSSRQSFDELIARFWLHQQRQELQSTEYVSDALKNLQLKYVIYKEALTFDLSQCFNDKFQTPCSQNVLDHLTFTRLKDYPPKVSSLCIEYLDAIAEPGKPSKYLVVSVSDMIVVGGKDI